MARATDCPSERLRFQIRIFSKIKLRVSRDQTFPYVVQPIRLIFVAAQIEPQTRNDEGGTVSTRYLSEHKDVPVKRKRTSAFVSRTRFVRARYSNSTFVMLRSFRATVRRSGERYPVHESAESQAECFE